MTDQNPLNDHLFASDSEAVARTLWRVFSRSAIAHGLASDLSFPLEALKSSFVYLTMRLLHASENGHVAISISVEHAKDTSNTCMTSTNWDFCEEKNAFLSALQNRSETLPNVVVKAPLLDALRDAGVFCEASALTNVDQFDRVVPWIWEPLDEAGGRLYLTRHFRQEWHVANDIATRLQTIPSFTPVSGKLDTLLAIEANNQYRNDEQLAAVKNASYRNFAVITGGPGTGKTTSVANLLALFLSDDPTTKQPRIALAAPTGKATARMRESLHNTLNDTRLPDEKKAFLKPLEKALNENKIPALTLDRWLVTNTSLGRRPSENNPIEADLFVVDEASMIDIDLAYKLFRVLDKKTRVILLGDANQLAAVGPGAVFAELASFSLDDDPIPVTSRLIKSWRYPDDSDIGRIASAICAGNVEALIGHDPIQMTGCLKVAPTGDVPDHLDSLLAAQSSDAVIEADACLLKASQLEGKILPLQVSRWIEGRLTPYIEALNAYLDAYASQADERLLQQRWRDLTLALSHFRYLCAARDGLFGVASINAFVENHLLMSLKTHLESSAMSPEMQTLQEAIQEAHKQRQNAKEARWHASYPGEVIIIRKNDRALDVVNGDIAIILPDEDGHPSIARLIDSERDIPLVLLPFYETAFAMTIHQSQGSEYSVVGVFMPVSEHSPLATRELLYTGVTRAKKKVRIFSTLETLERATTNKTARTTGLATRLQLQQSKGQNEHQLNELQTSAYNSDQN